MRRVIAALRNDSEHSPSNPRQHTMRTSDTGFKQGGWTAWAWRSYAVILMLVGISLMTGGVVLAWHDGSLYYAIAGLLVGSSGVQAWRGDRRAAPLFGVMLVGTLAWSIWEVGADPWGL